MGIETEIANKVRELRDRQGLTQEQFGALVGVTYTTVNRWENGRTKPSPLARRRIEEIVRRQKRLNGKQEEHSAGHQ